MKYLISLLLLMNINISQASSGPAGFNVQGLVTDNSGNQVTGMVDFQLQVMDKNKTCVLYQENFNGINLTTSSGVFSFNLGSGTSRINNVDTLNSTTLTSKVFRNDMNVAVSGSCPAGVVIASGDARVLRVLFNPGSGVIIMSPDITIQGAPYAMIAESIQGLTPSNFIQVNNSVNVNQSNLENIFTGGSYSQLLSLIAGTNSQYVSSSGGNFTPIGPINFNNQQITNVATPTSANQAANKSYTDGNVAGKTADPTLSTLSVSDSGKALLWNGVQWIAQTISTSDSTKLPLAGGAMTGHITMGGNQILSTGHMTMSNQSTLTIGSYTTAQQSTLLSSLTAANSGATWYNSSTSKMMYWNGTQALQVSDTASSVSTVFGRSGAVTTTAGDYNATQITNSPTGNIAAITTQSAINELDSEKLDKTGGSLTGNIQLNGQNQLRLADSDSSNFVALRSPATVASNIIWTLPNADGTSGQVLSTNGAGVLSWSNSAVGDITDITTNSGSALSGGVSSGNATLSVVTDNSTLEINGSNQLQVKDSGITNSKIFDLNISKLSNGPSDYFSYMPAGTECATGEVLKWNAVTDRWLCGSDNNSDTISSVFGRSGSVTATAGDYNATQITNSPTGNIAAITTQSAINELDSEKLDKTGGSLTGNIQLNGQNQLRLADSDSSNFVALRSPANVVADVTWTLPNTDGTSGQVLSTNGAGIMSWMTTNLGGDVTGAHTATTVAKIQGRNIASIAPTDGQVLVWNAGSSQWEPGPRRMNAVKTADESSTVVTMANITDMSFPVTAGNKYLFTFYVLYQSSVTTTGLRLGVTVPAGTISGNASFRIAADGAGSLFDGALTFSGDSVISTAVPVINTTYLAEVRGIFICTTTGTLQLTYGSEIAATSVTVKQNSTYVYETF